MEKLKVRALVSDMLTNTTGGMETVGSTIESVKTGIKRGILVRG